MAAFNKDRDYEFVQPLPEELTCSICMKVLHEPHMVNCCEQQYCKGCLDKWRKKNKTCPHCRSDDFASILMKQTNRKIGELKVYCPNKDHGCKAELKISEYESHLSTTNDKGCQYVRLDCPNNCQTKVFRGEMKTHKQKKCLRRAIICDLCNLEGEYHIIAGEHINKCPSFPLPCPLGCGAELIRKDLKSHRSACPLGPVLCPFRGLGCKTEVCRKDLDKHIETSTLQHMTVLAESHTALQAEHKALQKKVQDVASVLKSKPNIQSHQIAQIYTILVDCSTLTIGDTITLGISESGHHYIIVSLQPLKHSHKFKLEWEASASDRYQLQMPQTMFKLYHVLEADYPAMTAETKFDLLVHNNQGNNIIIQVCYEKLQREKQEKEVSDGPQLIKAFSLACYQKPITITTKHHEDHKCICSPPTYHNCTSCRARCSTTTKPPTMVKLKHTCKSCGRICYYNMI